MTKVWRSCSGLTTLIITACVVILAFMFDGVDRHQLKQRMTDKFENSKSLVSSVEQHLDRLKMHYALLKQGKRDASEIERDIQEVDQEVRLLIGKLL